MNIFHYQIYASSEMEIKNYDSFFKSALLLSGHIQLNPVPTSDTSFVCKRTLNKRSFCCTKSNRKGTLKCNNAVFFDSNICSDCTRSKNLPFHNVSFCTGKSSDTASFLLEEKLPSIPSHNEVWKVFKDKGLRFGYLNVNSLLSKIE